MLSKKPDTWLGQLYRRRASEFYSPFLPPAVERAIADVNKQRERLTEACDQIEALLPPVMMATGGRPKTWTDERLWQLLADFIIVGLANPKKSESWICRHLVRRRTLNGRYATYGFDTIRRKLSRARHAHKNLYPAALGTVELMLKLGIPSSDIINGSFVEAFLRHERSRVVASGEGEGETPWAKPKREHAPVTDSR